MMMNSVIQNPPHQHHPQRSKLRVLGISCDWHKFAPVQTFLDDETKKYQAGGVIMCLIHALFHGKLRMPDLSYSLLSFNLPVFNQDTSSFEDR